MVRTHVSAKLDTLVLYAKRIRVQKIHVKTGELAMSIRKMTEQLLLLATVRMGSVAIFVQQLLVQQIHVTIRAHVKL